MNADLKELYRLREGVAKLVMHDPVYLPIFARMEWEIEVAEAEDPVAKAKALLRHHNAIS